MKTYVTYGFYMALVGFLLNLAFYFAGFHADAAKLTSTQWIGTVLGLTSTVVVMFLGIRARRADVPLTEDFGYGRSFLAGFLIVLFACLFSIVTTYLYFHVINPNALESMIQAKLNEIEASGASGARLEQAETMTRKMMGSAPIFGAIGFCIGLIFGTLIALVVAIFTRRKAIEAVPPLAA